MAELITRPNKPYTKSITQQEQVFHQAYNSFQEMNKKEGYQEIVGLYKKSKRDADIVSVYEKYREEFNNLESTYATYLPKEQEYRTHDGHIDINRVIRHCGEGLNDNEWTMYLDFYLDYVALYLNCIKDSIKLYFRTPQSDHNKRLLNNYKEAFSKVYDNLEELSSLVRPAAKKEREKIEIFYKNFEKVVKNNAH